MMAHMLNCSEKCKQKHTYVQNSDAADIGTKKRYYYEEKIDRQLSDVPTTGIARFTPGRALMWHEYRLASRKVVICCWLIHRPRVV